MKPSVSPPSECANCGAAIPPRAVACPECGADERTGWREVDVYDGLDLPDEAWGDDRSDRGSALPGRGPGQLAWYWWATGLFLLLALGMTFLGLR